MTHDTPGGIASACAAALMTHFFLYRCGEKRDLGRFITSYIPGKWNQVWQGKVGGAGEMSVRAAITAVIANDSLARLLRDCIGFGGDVDTVASIALAAASYSHEYQRDLPEFLFDELENGVWGRDSIRQLDGKLLARAARV